MLNSKHCVSPCRIAQELRHLFLLRLVGGSHVLERQAPQRKRGRELPLHTTRQALGLPAPQGAGQLYPRADKRQAAVRVPVTLLSMPASVARS